MDDAIGFVAVAGGLLLGFMAILLTQIKAMSRRKEIEISRREIAAYIAEGTMSPADGQALLQSDPQKDSCG